MDRLGTRRRQVWEEIEDGVEEEERGDKGYCLGYWRGGLGGIRVMWGRMRVRLFRGGEATCDRCGVLEVGEGE